MSASQAQARCPEITLLTRSPSAESATRDLLHSLAGAHTSDFEATAEGVCTLDLFANPRARQRCAELGQGMVDAFARENLRARAGFAATPDLALLAAKLARPVHIVQGDDDSLRHFLDPLPLEVLAPSTELLELLHLWGIRNLGQLRALPAEKVSSRLGREARDLCALATGGGRRLLTLVRPPQTFVATHDLDHPIDNLAALALVLRRLLEQVCARLAAAYRAAGTLTLTLHFDNGHASARPFRIPDPSTDIDLLEKVLLTSLENETAPAPVTGIRVEATPARRARHQFGLFESSLRDPHRFAETLARLESLLGGGRSGSPSPADTHLPDSFTTTPFNPQSSETPSPISQLSSSIALPLRRFRPPWPVEVALVPGLDHLPRPAALLAGPVRGRLLDAAGPWASSGDWWQADARWSRQEWDIQLASSGALYRLVRSGGEWLLDGEYG